MRRLRHRLFPQSQPWLIVLHCLLVAAPLFASPAIAALNTANIQTINTKISVQGWKFVPKDQVAATVTWQMKGGWPARLSNVGNRVWDADVTVKVYAKGWGSTRMVGSSGPYSHSWLQGGKDTLSQTVKFKASAIKKAAWTGKAGGGYGEYKLYAKISMTAKPKHNTSQNFVYKVSGSTPARSVQLVKKGSYSKGGNKSAGQPGAQSKADKQGRAAVKKAVPKYKIVKAPTKVRVPYTAVIKVKEKRTVQQKKKVRKVRMVDAKCYRDKKVTKKVTVSRKVPVQRKVKKTRMVEKKVTKKVEVTKYRTVEKKVPKEVTKTVEKVTGKKKVVRKLKSTKWVEKREPYYVNETVTEMRPVSKTKKVAKTRYVNKQVKEPYTCKKNVVVGKKTPKPTWTTKKIKRYKTEKKPYQAKEIVMVSKQVREPYVVSRKVTKYRTEKKAQYKTTYTYRYKTVYKNGKKHRVKKRVPVRKKIYVDVRVPYQAAVKERKYRMVAKKVPQTRTVTKYKVVRTPYWKTVRVKVPSPKGKTTVQYKTVKDTCYRTVTKKAPEKYFVEEKVTVKEPVKANKKVTKYRTVKKPAEMVREVYSYEPIKQKVRVKETIYVTKKVKEPYKAYENKTVTEKAPETYFETVTDYQIKQFKELKQVTVREPYTCQKKQEYFETITVPKTETVMVDKKVTKYRFETKYISKRVPVQ